MTRDRWFRFVGGERGSWVIESNTRVIGDPLATAARLDIRDEADHSADSAWPAAWALRGVRSNERYTTQAEHERLAASSAGLGRAEATMGALIPIRKSPAWWALSQDQRRDVFEGQSRHIAASMRYLPAVARRLFHCRDIAGETFDFLTWFEYAPEHAGAFDELVATLRATAEWTYVDREVDIRVRRDARNG